MQSMDETRLREKLMVLREKLRLLETVETEKIRLKRIGADMGDDFRENEGAKMVMEDHEMLYMRIVKLKREIWALKKQILNNKSI